MANYQAPDTEFQAVANAIRTKGGTSGQLTWPSGFVSAINAIPSGGGGSNPLEHIQTLGNTQTESQHVYASFGDINGQFFYVNEIKNGVIELSNQQQSDLMAILQDGYDCFLRYTWYEYSGGGALGCDIHIYEAGAVTYEKRPNNFGYNRRICNGTVPIRYFGVSSNASLALCDVGTNSNGFLVIRPRWDLSQLNTNSITTANIANNIATALLLSSDFT